jgi:arabinofuranosyltransferase
MPLNPRPTPHGDPGSPPLRFLEKIWYLLIGFLILTAVFLAWKLHWICDDTFITLLYVEHWIDGEGIVYNPGERVEGYTHFLWMLILAGIRNIGLDPVPGSQVVGVACYACILLLSALLSCRTQAGSRTFFPYTLLVLVFHLDFRIWMTGGLETSLFTLEILLMLYLCFFSMFSSSTRLLLSGILLGLMVMTRPDAMLFYFWANLCLFIGSWSKAPGLRPFIQAAIRMNLPFIIIIVP